MRALIAAASIALIALAIYLWRDLHAPDAEAAPRAKPPVTAALAPVKPPLAAATTTTTEPHLAPVDEKVNVNSDDFFDRYVERQPKIASRAAMSCYRGGMTMDQSIKVSFVGHVTAGEATLSDVKILASSLGDKAIEDCMVAAIQRAHFHDDTLPDVAAYPDQTVLTPERGGKKYLHPRDDNAPPAPADTPR